MPAPGYSSITDIRDRIVALDHTATNTFLTSPRVSRVRGQITGEIDAALESGGYSAPPVSSVTSTTSGAEVASTDTEVIAVADGTGFSAALALNETLVRIFGLSGTDFNDEFTEMVAVSGNNITVFATQQGYDSGAVVESITGGFKQLRNVEAKGTAATLLLSIDIRSEDRNEKVVDMLKEYNKCISGLMDGTMKLGGFTVTSGAITSWQQENGSDPDVQTSPVIELSEPF